MKCHQDSPDLLYGAWKVPWAPSCPYHPAPAVPGGAGGWLWLSGDSLAQPHPSAVHLKNTKHNFYLVGFMQKVQRCLLGVFKGCSWTKKFWEGCLVFQGVLQLEVIPWEAGRLHCSAASRTFEFWAPWWLWQHRHCWRRLGLQEEQSIIATLKHFFYNWLAPL